MKVHHIALSVKNLEETVNFYKKLFGFEEVKNFERKDLGGKAIFLKLNEIQLEIWEFNNKIKNKDDFSNLNILGIKHIAFEVNDIEKTYNEIKSRGIEISEPKQGASGKRYCFLKDPNGFPLELYEK